MKKTGFTISFEDGATHTLYLQALEQAAYVATVQPKAFDGSYGIDWCTMNSDFTKIETFQETKVSDISHVLDPNTTQFKPNPTEAEQQSCVKALYPTATFLNTSVPITWIHLAKNKVATLEITPVLISGSTDKKHDFLTIEKNSNFEISHKGVSDAGATAPPVKLKHFKSGKPLTVEIKALQTFTQAQELLIKDYLGRDVGKIEMAANAPVDLDIKIIPVVFNPTTQIADAQRLYAAALQSQNHQQNNLKQTLQEKAFNQVGVHCNILPIDPTPECVLVDTTKDNWSQFYKQGILQDWNYTQTSLKPKVSVDEDGEKRYHARSLETRRFVLDKLEDAYYKQFDPKKTFKGALIFVTDKDYKEANYQGYSQTDPLRSQGTIVFKKGLQDATVYAHELGHMLGLEHNFFKDLKNLNETNNNLKDLVKGKSISDRKQAINNIIHHQEAYIVKNIEELKELKLENKSKNVQIIKEKEEDIESTKKLVQKEKDKLKKISINTTIANLKVVRGKSKNFMDYINDRIYFSKTQAEILKGEANDFYR